jgi:hypothetical protein
VYVAPVCYHITIPLTHLQRGGQGNVYKEKYGGHSHSPERKGLGDKVKHALGIDKDKKPEQPSPLHNEAKD